MRRRLITALCFIVCLICDVHAHPQTAIRPRVSLSGEEEASRFGSEIACGMGAGVSSLIAVGGPLSQGGRGAVWLFKSLIEIGAPQVLEPQVGTGVSRFGEALRFIRDINGDGREELLVGAPGASIDDSGVVYAFLSGDSANNNEYTACGQVQGAGGFGSRLYETSSQGVPLGVQIVIGTDQGSGLQGYDVALDGQGRCVFMSAMTGPFVGLGGEGFQGVESSLYIAAQSASSARSSVTVYSTAEGPEATAVCTRELGSAENTDGVMPYVVALDRVFHRLFSSESVVFASSLSEPTTGGAFGLLGVSALGCSEFITLNNCQDDPQQEQGRASTQGGKCKVTLEGESRDFVVVGSPGWNTGRGRIDVYVEGDELVQPIECKLQTPLSSADLLLEAPTPTPTASAIVEDAPTLGESLGLTPAVSDTSTETPTPTPTSTSTTLLIAPSVEITAAPFVPTLLIPAIGTPLSTDVVGGALTSTPAGVGVGGGNLADGISDATPIVVSPGSANLPAPEVRQQGVGIEVIMPTVRPELSSAEKATFVRRLLKSKRITRGRAEAIVSESRNLIVTYIIEYMEVGVKRAFSLIQSAYADSARSSRATSVKRVRSRLNRVTLARLKSGGLYEVSYRIEISVSSPRMVVGMTGPSGKTRFSAP